MSLEDIVSLTITASTATPTRPGFGTPLVAGYHTKFVDLVRSYGKISELVADGFATSDPIYMAVSDCMAQNPRPAHVKVGRRATATTQVHTLTVTSAVENDVYEISTVAAGASGAHDYTYTVPNGATLGSVAVAVAALLDAHSDLGATSAAAVITTTTVAGKLVFFKEWTQNFQPKNTSADPGIATDLAAIFAADADWYGLILDSNGKAEVVAAAAWAETNKKLFAYQTSDYEVGSGATADVMSTLAGSSYDYSIGFYNGKNESDYTGAAMLGNRFPYDPGSDTWAYKTLSGIAVDDLVSCSSTRQGQILGKKGNIYTTVAGLNVTQYGKMASGEWADTIRFLDWLNAEVTIRVFAALANNQKIPYTNAGVDVVKSVILGALQDGEKRGGLVIGSSTVTAPDVADISTADKNSRILPDVEFTALLAGAIHTVQISGLVSV